MIRFRWFFLTLWLLAMAASADAPAKTAHALKPGLDMSVYRRSFTLDEAPTVRLSAYNIQTVQMTIYRIDLPALTPTSEALEHFGAPIQAVDVRRLPVAARWAYSVAKGGPLYPDSWSEREVRLPKLPGGVYLISGIAGGIEKRTWYAATDIALLAKRTRNSVLIFAAQAHTGAPQAGVPLTLTDAAGRQYRGITDGQGLWRGAAPGAKGNLWVYGEHNGSPAFVLSGEPPSPDPYAVYTTTDRPIYRPGQQVQFKATIRRRLAPATPGAYTYQTYAGQPAVIEVRDATDALILHRDVKTNAFGSVDCALPLAAEPTLGHWQIVVSIGDFHSYGGFEVQAYRKPEYTAQVQCGAEHYLGGALVPVTISANYLFGQPVAGAAVHYTINFSAEGDGSVEPSYEGQGVTDAQGKLTLQIQTQRHPVNRELSVQATITDLSRRSVAASGATLITSGSYQLAISSDKSVYHPGEPVSVSVIATDYDNKPVSAKVQVQLLETKYDFKHRPYIYKITQQVTTDRSGKGTVRFTPERPGDLQLEAESFDEDGNKIAASSSVWVIGTNEIDYDYPTLDLVPDRAEYRPGEMAIVLLNTSLVTPHPVVKPGKQVPKTYPDGWGLVTLEGEGLYRTEIVHIIARSTMLRIPLTEAEFPAASLHVTIVQEKHIYEQQVELAVRRDDQKLQVTVAPSQDKFSPGGTATYTVTTRDWRGRPVPAEVSVGVVDAAIYAIAPDNAADLGTYFYPPQEVRLQTDFSFAAMYSGGAYQTVAHDAPGASAAGPGGIRVRREFADTAYWNPYVDTDATGTTQVSFTVPDNLTTWRATARAITADTRGGGATHDTVSSMPLLVRLELPRFAVEGDETTVSAIIHNYTGAPKVVKATLQASGVTVTGDLVRSVPLDAGGQQRVEWRARITPQPHAVADAVGGVRFLISADGGTGAQDAVELTLPTHPDGLKMVTSQAELLSGLTDVSRLDLATLPPDTTLTVTLAPSIGSAVLNSLGYLMTYPYGCAEQTMSALLPDLMVARTLRRLHLDAPADLQPAKLDQAVNLGLQKLYRYQHSDGGWNWWDTDQTDGGMTAYVLWGLIQARDAGYVVDDQRIRRGTQALMGLLSREQDPSHRADYLLTLVYTGPNAFGGPLKELFAKRKALDLYGRASLCLALARTGSPLALTVARELSAAGVRHGTTVYWPAEQGGYSWRDSDTEVTAHVLRALLAAQPTSPGIPAGVRWLLGNRTGRAWESTRASAESVFALSQYMESTGEAHGSFNAAISLDGTPIGHLSAAGSSVLAPPTTFTFGPDQLRGHKTLTVDKGGAGTLYLTRTETYLLPPEQATPRSSGIAVHRSFQITTDNPIDGSSVASGAQINVTVTLNAESNYRYAMLEEPIPAGCEVNSSGYGGEQPDVAWGGAAGYAREEVRDDKIVFFFDSLPKGPTTVSYTVHAETPGAYHILPSLASLVYFPEVRGSGGLAQAAITDKQP